MNDDAVAHPAWLEKMVRAAEARYEIGMCAPQIRLYGTNLLDSAGMLLCADGSSKQRGHLERPDQYARATDVLFPSGCAALYKRAMLDEIGLFDEDLFAYCDDTDLGLRARLAGWRCRSVPAAVVYHKYSAASAAYSPLKAFLVERNRAWVAIKCLPGPLLAVSPLFTVARLGAQAFGALTHRGAAGRFAADHSPFALIIVLLRAYAAALAGLPATWGKRRSIQRDRRVSAWEPITWLRRWGMGVREVALKD